MISFVYIYIKIFTKMTSFSFFKYFDAFELDVKVVNFVYYGKTRLSPIFLKYNVPMYERLVMLLVFMFAKVIRFSSI